MELAPIIVDPALLLNTTREEILTCRGWLVPDFANESGDILFHFQAFIVEAGGKRIMVDPCIGNGKSRAHPQMNMLETDFLARIAKAGFPRESIDYVLCTHLHADHCGWNTMLVDGEWVPTFPKARYLISKSELDFARSGKDDAEAVAIYNDSVRPVVEAGLVDLVEPGHLIVDGVRLEHTPGHTPGHTSVMIESQGREAIITGDVMHHPIQVSLPHISSHFCWDCNTATETRQGILKRAGDAGAALVAAHFAGPVAVYIEPAGNTWKVVKA